MVDLLGGDGKTYTFPDDKKADALANGFTEVAKTEPTKASVLNPVGPDVAPLVGGAGPIPLPEEPNQSLVEPPGAGPVGKAAAAKTEPQIGLIGGDKNLYMFPRDKYEEALKQGFTPASQEQIDAAQKGPLGLLPQDKVGRTIESGLVGAIEHLPFVQEAPAPPGFTPEEMAKRENKAAYYIGAGGGEIAGALGPLSTAAKAVPLIPALGAYGKAAQLAAQGAVYSASPVTKSLLEGNFADAGIEALSGSLINIGLHGMGGLVGAISERSGAYQKVLDEHLAEKAATEAASGVGGDETAAVQNAIGKAMKMTPKQIVDLGDQLRPMMKSAGVVPEDFVKDNGQAVIEKLQALEKSGPEIGKAIKELDTLPGKESIIEKSLLDASKEIKAQAPEAFAKADLDEQIARLKAISPKDSEKLIQSAVELYGNDGLLAQRRALGKMLPSEKQALSVLSPIIDELEGTARKGTFADAQKFKQFVGEQTNWTDNKFANRLRKQSYGHVVDALSGEGGAEDLAAQQLAASGRGNIANITDGLAKQRALYSYYKTFGDIVDKKAASMMPEDLMAKIVGTHGSHRAVPIMMMHLLGVPTPVSVVAGIGLPFLKSFMQKRAVLGAARKLLADDSQKITQAVIGVAQKHNEEISKGAKELISSMGRGLNAAAVSAPVRVMDHYMNSDGVGEAEDKQSNALRNALGKNLSDPEAFANNVSHPISLLKQAGLDSVAQKYSDHQLRLMKVIQSFQPNDPSSQTPHPFAANVDEGEILPETKQRYHNALKLAADPQHLFEKIRQGTITPGDVAIVAAVNPMTLQRMREELVKEAMKSKPDLTYQNRLSVGVFMGGNIDESTDQIPVLQSVYGQAPPMGSAGTPPAKKGRKAGAAATQSAKAASNYLTTAEKAAGHGM